MFLQLKLVKAPNLREFGNGCDENNQQFPGESSAAFLPSDRREQKILSYIEDRRQSRFIEHGLFLNFFSQPGPLP